MKVVYFMRLLLSFSAKRKANSRQVDRPRKVLIMAEFCSRSDEVTEVVSTLMKETTAPAALNFGQFRKANTTPNMPKT